jgi:hypothetical protein
MTERAKRSSKIPGIAMSNCPFRNPPGPCGAGVGNFAAPMSTASHQLTEIHTNRGAKLHYEK